MMVDRTATRDAERGRLDPTRTPPAPVDAVIVARTGLDGLLAEELAGIGCRVRRARRGVPDDAGRARGAPGALFAARTMLGVRFPLPPEWVSDTSSLEEAVARAITSDAARAVLSHVDGRPRALWRGWRLRRQPPARGHVERGPRGRRTRAGARQRPDRLALGARNRDPRPLGGSLARAAGARRPALRLATGRRPGHLAPDGIAAAWRASRAGAPTTSSGTRSSARAPSSSSAPCSAPCASSGGRTWTRARSTSRAGTSPPPASPRRSSVGRPGGRAARRHAGHHESAHGPPRLAHPRAGGHARPVRRPRGGSSVVPPGGRLVWVAPWPARARAAAGEAKVLDRALVVDMGGFDAEMQRWTKPTR